MPDATFDWDSAQERARETYLSRSMRENPEPGRVQQARGEGWDAAINWITRVQVVKALGGEPERVDP